MAIENTDKSNVRNVIIDFPQQFEEGLKAAGDAGFKKNFKDIIICGMGGSALPGNVLACWLDNMGKKHIPIYIHRDYGLPLFADKTSLLICISFSGNTEESISALEEAIKENLCAIGISTGGKIEAICKEKNLPFVKIPKKTEEIQPRFAMGYLFSALAKVLANSGIIEDSSKEILETAENLKNIVAEQEKEGKEIAKTLVNKIPLVYSSNKFKCLARIWKIKFNENSKIPAFHNYFPELNHNEMVGFTQIEKCNNFYALIIKDQNDYPQNLKRMELMASFLEKGGIGVKLIEIRKGATLFKIFSTLLLGDWVSYYLALEYKIDPTPVKIVEDFKKELK